MSIVEEPANAAPSMLGYLQQVRLALLGSLRRLREHPDLCVWIEWLDDVDFDLGSSGRDLLQSKHKLKAEADLGDAAVDVWRTVGNWSRLEAKGAISDTNVLYLVTTTRAADDLAVARLRMGKHRDAETARVMFDGVAVSSVNVATKRDRADYLALDVDRRTRLLDRVIVVDESPTILETRELIEQELVLTVELRFRAPLADRLEGWWFDRVIRHLVAVPREPITGGELRGKLADLREQFARTNLPIDDDLRDLIEGAVDWEEFKNLPFMEQLRMFVRPGSRRLLFAMHDYYGASEQRGRWQREDLLLVNELRKYDARLTGEWARRFEQMMDALDAQSNDELKVARASGLYTWVENDASFPIRPMCDEPFVTRGSYHLLADEGRVGWHPDFRDRLAHLFREKNS